MKNTRIIHVGMIFVLLIVRCDSQANPEMNDREKILRFYVNFEINRFIESEMKKITEKPGPQSPSEQEYINKTLESLNFSMRCLEEKKYVMSVLQFREAVDYLSYVSIVHSLGTEIPPLDVINKIFELHKKQEQELLSCLKDKFPSTPVGYEWFSFADLILFNPSLQYFHDYFLNTPFDSRSEKTHIMWQECLKELANHNGMLLQLYICANIGEVREEISKLSNTALLDTILRDEAEDLIKTAEDKYAVTESFAGKENENLLRDAKYFSNIGKVYFQGSNYLASLLCSYLSIARLESIGLFQSGLSNEELLEKVCNEIDLARLAIDEGLSSSTDMVFPLYFLEPVELDLKTSSLKRNELAELFCLAKASLEFAKIWIHAVEVSTSADNVIIFQPEITIESRIESVEAASVVTTFYYFTPNDPMQLDLCIKKFEEMSKVQLQVNNERKYFREIERENPFTGQEELFFFCELNLSENDQGEITFSFDQRIEFFVTPLFLGLQNPLKEYLFPLDYYEATMWIEIPFGTPAVVEFSPPENFVIDKKRSGLYVPELAVSKPEFNIIIGKWTKAGEFTRREGGVYYIKDNFGRVIFPKRITIGLKRESKSLLYFTSFFLFYLFIFLLGIYSRIRSISIIDTEKMNAIITKKIPILPENRNVLVLIYSVSLVFPYFLLTVPLTPEDVPYLCLFHSSSIIFVIMTYLGISLGRRNTHDKKEKKVDIKKSS